MILPCIPAKRLLVSAALVLSLNGCMLAHHAENDPELERLFADVESRMRARGDPIWLGHVEPHSPRLEIISPPVPTGPEKTCDLEF